MQSNIRFGSGIQDTHGMMDFTPLFAEKFPLSRPTRPMGLLPILLCCTRQHSRDHQHGHDEWVSGYTGKMARSRLAAPAKGCVALRCAALRWSMPVQGRARHACHCRTAKSPGLPLVRGAPTGQPGSAPRTRELDLYTFWKLRRQKKYRLVLR